MQTHNNEHLHELTSHQIEQVSGGVIFVPALYAAFVSGAKWGAGVALATYAVHVKLK